VPDIVELLRDTARDGTSAPDLAWLAQRARHLHVRQRAVQTLAVVAVLVAVPVALTLPGRQDALEQLPATHPTASAPATPTTPEPALQPSPAGTGGYAAPAGSPEPISQPAARHTSEASAGASTRPAPTAAGYTRAASCHVSTRDLSGGPTWACRFTATKPGGWQLTRGVAVFAGYDPATVRVTVERRGTMVYSTDGVQQDCTDGVVQPGDRVEVSIESRSASHVEDLDVGAGAGYGCS
jgi:hypothetical protein